MRSELLVAGADENATMEVELRTHDEVQTKV